MKKNYIIRLLLTGTLIWVVPFVISFAFYDRSGKLNVNYDFFKSFMIVVSSLTSMYALARYFRSVNGNYLRKSLTAGIVWLIINLLLDMFILIPMAKMPLEDYFMAIGVRYLQIPIFCLTVGIILQERMMKSLINYK
jgi:hypothetical protein